MKGGTTDEAFRGQHFPWERGASVCVDFDHFNFQNFSTEGKEKNKKADRFSFTNLILFKCKAVK